MNVGLCTISAKERAVGEILELAGEVGYDGVEIWGRDHVGDGSPAVCRQVGASAEESGLEIPVYGSYLRCGTGEFDEELEGELAIADRLEAGLIRVWAGNQEYGDSDEEHWNRVVSDLERLSERAAAYGIGVTVEKHANTLTNDLDGARQLIKVVDRDNCRLNYQPGFGIPPVELEREANALADLSNNLHLQAVRTRGESDRCPLSAAYYDLDAVLDPFFGSDNDFDGYGNVEFVTDDSSYKEAIASDLQHLRSVIENRSQRAD